MEKEVVKELIQNEFNEDNLKLELDKLLNQSEYRNEMIKQLIELKNKLGGGGASKKTAELMLSYLKN